MIRRFDVLVCLIFLTSLVHADVLEEIVVLADQSLESRHGEGMSLSVLSSQQLKRIRAAHPNEALVRVPGTWISRGSGQEHLTAIRSGVLTGAGACGEFLFLENGLPIRPAGFCNINNLFELNTEIAGQLEVLRGPASASLGGNAVHGAINVVLPSIDDGKSLSLEYGGDNYGQLRGHYSHRGKTQSLRVDFIAMEEGGYRDETGYGQQKLNGLQQFELADWQVSNAFTATLLNQETGGFVRGEDAYEDDDLRDTNPNPEAFRDAWSLRVSSRWEKTIAQNQSLVITPYLRRSKMKFKQHFLPGQPTERNQQISAGILTTWNQQGRFDVSVGAQVEGMQGALDQVQVLPTVGSNFLMTTRPAGTHYDYEVDSLLVALFYNLSTELTTDLEIYHSLRIETLAYDYDNLHTVGNLRDDGTPCGFGGCLYQRPADRDDRFTNVAGRLGLNYRFSDTVTAYAVFGMGFRPPQATELYRLQNDQTTADLDSEELLSFEVGVSANWQSLHSSVAIYSQSTDQFIFRDSEGFNVSDGRTEGTGIEVAATYNLNELHTLNLAASYARHEYDFNRAAALGENIQSGNAVDTAPRLVGSFHWLAQYERVSHELELVYLDSYYLNAANTQSYPGHFLVNLRGDWQINEKVTVFARITNLLDEDYADRADFAFGGFRYFPGTPRRGFVGVDWTF